MFININELSLGNRVLNGTIFSIGYENGILGANISLPLDSTGGRFTPVEIIRPVPISEYELHLLRIPRVEKDNVYTYFPGLNGVNFPIYHISDSLFLDDNFDLYMCNKFDTGYKVTWLCSPRYIHTLQNLVRDLINKNLIYNTVFLESQNINL